MEPKSLQNLKPRALIDLARMRAKADFAEGVGAPVLLVRLDDPTSELGRALTEASTVGGERVEAAMGFETAVRTADDLSVGRSRPAGAVFGAAQIQTLLVRAVHFAVPLCKRKDAGKSFTARISVGRARNNDVVLRHKSVSKFHAWFQRDDNEIFYLSDATSKNGTQVNGADVPSGGRVALASGDEIRFGAVEGVVCTPELLWEAISPRGKG